MPLMIYYVTHFLYCLPHTINCFIPWLLHLSESNLHLSESNTPNVVIWTTGWTWTTSETLNLSALRWPQASSYEPSHSVVLTIPLWLCGAGSLWFFDLSLLFPSYFLLLFYLAFIFGPHFNHSFTNFFFFTPYSHCPSIHSFGKCSVQGFYFPTSNPDSWASLKMIPQPHVLMPKLNEAFSTS